MGKLFLNHFKKMKYLAVECHQIVNSQLSCNWIFSFKQDNERDSTLVDSVNRDYIE